jgi:NAD(P)H-dependent flavin oxidoreductase YrpB (nitropropane dioxygenase family)
VVGREPELRRRREEAWTHLEELERSNADYGLMWMGQSAGLIDSVRPAGDVAREIIAEAEEVLRSLDTYAAGTYGLPARSSG